MEVKAVVEGNYNKLKEDVEAMDLMIDKYVRVQLIKNTLFTGFVHSIDPVSHSIILLVPQEQSYQTVLLPGHAILDITETEPFTNAKLPSRKTNILNSDPDRKQKVIQWLKWNLLPVTEDGDKIVIGNASLLPPYSATDICTNNPMVALQTRKILERMPEEFHGLP